MTVLDRVPIRLDVEMFVREYGSCHRGAERVAPLWLDEIGASRRETVLVGVFQVGLNHPLVERAIRRAFEYPSKCVRLVEKF